MGEQELQELAKELKELIEQYKNTYIFIPRNRRKGDQYVKNEILRS